MSKFMTEISHLNALAPFDVVRDEEEDHFLAQQMGNGFDIQDRVFGTGIPFIYAGNNWSIEANSDEISDFLEEWTETEESFEMLLEESTLSELGKGERDDEHYAELEDIREHHEEVFPDNATRRRVELAGYFRDTILLKLIVRFIAEGVNPSPLYVDLEAYSKGSGGEDAADLFKEFPTAYTYITLSISRDLQKQRKIQRNDLDDLTALAVAIPYCDTVVTENMWKHEAKVQDLDDIYDTTVVSNLEELIPILQNTS